MTTFYAPVPFVDPTKLIPQNGDNNVISIAIPGRGYRVPGERFSMPGIRVLGSAAQGHQTHQSYQYDPSKLDQEISGYKALVFGRGITPEQASTIDEISKALGTVWERYAELSDRLYYAGDKKGPYTLKNTQEQIDQWRGLVRTAVDSRIILTVGETAYKIIAARLSSEKYTDERTYSLGVLIVHQGQTMFLHFKDFWAVQDSANGKLGDWLLVQRVFDVSKRTATMQLVAKSLVADPLMATDESVLGVTSAVDPLMADVDRVLGVRI